jgi:DNA-directed RNA polymerase subunit F
MSDSRGRLLAEGVECLVEKRVNDLVESITADIIALKIADLKAEIQAEVKAIVNDHVETGRTMLDVMVEIQTKKKD